MKRKLLLWLIRVLRRAGVRLDAWREQLVSAVAADNTRRIVWRT